jgi:hypothetical protein
MLSEEGSIAASSFFPLTATRICPEPGSYTVLPALPPSGIVFKSAFVVASMTASASPYGPKTGSV